MFTKMKLLKTKALLQIFLIITLTFYTALSFRNLNQEQFSENKILKKQDKFKFNYLDFIKQDLLPSVDAQGDFCCEKTTTGAYCIDNRMNPSLTRNNCAPGKLIDGVRCSQASSCQTGCCIGNNQCSRQTTEAACTDVNGQFISGDSFCTSAQASQCRLGCCILPNSYTMKTLQQCNQESSALNLPTQWNPSLSELQCANLATTNTFTYGCCVLGSGSSANDFRFTTSQQCGNGQFYSNTYCSDVPNTLCTRKFRTGCIENKNEVYWLDSCGNPENIYGTDSNPNCNPNNANIANTNCGYCSYDKGSICGQASSSFKSSLPSSLRNKVNHMCISLNCPVTYDNPAVPWDGGQKTNLQSWCEYDGVIGDRKDLVGSGYRYNYCYKGKEYVEECNNIDGIPRSNVCVQNALTNPTEAYCKPSPSPACLYCNSDNVDNNEECCSLNAGCDWQSFRSSVRRSGWGDSSEKQIVGFCAPKYTLNLEKSIPTESAFKIECNEIFRNPAIGGRYCIANCYCNSPSFITTLYNVCNSLGDYGLKYNIVGKEYAGFTFSGSDPDYNVANYPIIQRYSYTPTLSGILDNFVSSDIEEETLREYRENIGAYISSVESIRQTLPSWTAESSFGPEDNDFWGDPEFVIYNFNYECKPYRPPSGGNDCNKCIDQELLSKTGMNICNKYRCESLGRSCKFTETSNGKGTCSLIGQTDTTPPIISPLTTYLSNKGYQISTSQNTGYTVTSPIFLPGQDVEIAVKTQDDSGLPSLCKITKEAYQGLPTNSAKQQFFDSIPDEFNGISYEHKKTITFDFGQQTNTLTYTRGENTFYIHCDDHAGNIKLNYYVRFRVDETQPLTPPIIDLTSFTVPSGSYLRNNIGSIQVSFNVNQPANCRYSLTPGISYDLMEQSNRCSTIPFSGKNVCTFNLTPIIDAQENKFYIKCKSAITEIQNQNDQPQDGYILYGTLPLSISNFNPQNTVVYTSRFNLEATTSGGAENGKANCYFNRLPTITKLNSIKFLNTNANTHSQPLNLQRGEYTYNILCIDKAGNEDRKQAIFTVDTPDLQIISASPNEETLYTSDVKIEVITNGGADGNGNAECTYLNPPQYPLLTGLLNEKVQLDTDKTLHRKNLTLNPSTPTEYNITINCQDSANKKANTSIMFSVNVVSYPNIIRLYKSANKLYILVNRPATCKYSLNDVNFNYETTTQKLDDNSDVLKSVTLTAKQIYIKCKDTRTGRFGPPTGSYKIYP